MVLALDRPSTGSGRTAGGVWPKVLKARCCRTPFVLSLSKDRGTHKAKSVTLNSITFGGLRLRVRISGLASGGWVEMDAVPKAGVAKQVQYDEH